MTSWAPGTPVRLPTKRCVLRSLTRQDVGERYAGWLRDPEVLAMLNNRNLRMTEEQLIAYVERFDNRANFHLGIEAAGGGPLIGFYSVYCDPPNGVAQTNVMVGDHDYWGKNVVLETRAVLLDFLFDVVGVEKVYGMPLARNVASVFNYRAQGFHCEGILRQQRRGPEGERLDQLFFGMLRSEWHEKRAKPAP